jgi:hypothetical protein
LLSTLFKLGDLVATHRYAWQAFLPCELKLAQPGAPG